MLAETESRSKGDVSRSPRGGRGMHAIMVKQIEEGFRHKKHMKGPGEEGEGDDAGPWPWTTGSHGVP